MDGCVYCYQYGSSDCYKVGLTKNSVSQRLKSVSVGSPVRPRVAKEIRTKYPSLLENQIHWRLDAQRAENGEFFNVNEAQLEQAINESVADIQKRLPIIQQADRLKHVKPKSQVLKVTEKTRHLYQQLKEAERQAFFLSRLIETLQSELKIEIGENAGIEGIASWKLRECLRFDLALFKKEQPKLFKKYRKQSATRYFHLFGRPARNRKSPAEPACLDLLAER